MQSVWCSRDPPVDELGMSDSFVVNDVSSDESEEKPQFLQRTSSDLLKLSYGGLLHFILEPSIILISTMFVMNTDSFKFDIVGTDTEISGILKKQQETQNEKIQQWIDKFLSQRRVSFYDDKQQDTKSFIAIYFIGVAVTIGIVMIVIAYCTRKRKITTSRKQSSQLCEIEL